MPNWVYNNLSIVGSEEEVQKVKRQLGRSIQKRYADEKETRYTNPIISFWNIVSPPPNKIDEYFGTHGYADGKKQGETEYNWYNFNNREWGTKWDIAVSDDEKYSDTSLETNSATLIAYRFNTAWSPPISAFDTLAQQYPNLEITLEWEEEQGFGGTYVWIDGEGSETDSYDSPSSHADFVERDNEDGCQCSHNEDQDDWYKDCPREAVLELQAEQQLQIVGE